MESKQSYLKFIKEHPVFKESLKNLDDEQAKNVTKLAEEFAKNVANALLPVIEKIKNDPKFANDLRNGLNNKEGSLVKKEDNS